jgi:ketosteroid isomerase-like protein
VRLAVGGMRKILIPIAFVVVSGCTEAAAPQPDLAPVVAAERAFAAQAATSGWVEAFEAHSSADAIVLQAGPINAHESLATIDPANRSDTSLTWGPEYAAIARSGDFGFTTGPFNGGGTAFGQYFTVWRRQPDGAWKWIYDGGTDTAEPTTVNVAADVQAVGVLAPEGLGSAEAAIAAVVSEEARFAAAAARHAGVAYGAVMSATGRANRSQRPTAVGPAGVQALLGEGQAIRFSPPSVRQASAAGDMVFTLGEARWEGGAGYYQRIWVLERAGWRVAFDQILDRTLDVPPSP